MPGRKAIGRRPRAPLWGRFSTCGRFPTGLPRASANAAKAGCKPAAGWKPAPQSIGESTSTSRLTGQSSDHEQPGCELPGAAAPVRLTANCMKGKPFSFSFEFSQNRVTLDCALSAPTSKNEERLAGQVAHPLRAGNVWRRQPSRQWRSRRLLRLPGRGLSVNRECERPSEAGSSRSGRDYRVDLIQGHKPRRQPGESDRQRHAAKGNRRQCGRRESRTGRLGRAGRHAAVHRTESGRIHRDGPPRRWHCPPPKAPSHRRSPRPEWRVSTPVRTYPPGSSCRRRSKPRPRRCRAVCRRALETR